MIKTLTFLCCLIFFTNTLCATPGVNSDEIIIGQSCALTGPAKALGLELLRGAQSFFDKANQEGINGRKIKVISYDDKYEPLKCQSNTKKLIFQDKVFCLFGYVGTPTTKAILPILEKTQIPLIAPFTGASFLRNPKRNIINFRCSYIKETDALVKYFSRDLGLKKIGALYQRDSYGHAGLKGVLRATKRYDVDLAGTGAYLRNTLNVSEAVRQVLSYKAEAIICIGAYKPSAKIVKLIKAKDNQVKIANISFVGTQKLLEEMGSSGEGTYISQVMPSPYDETIPIIKECHETLGKIPSYSELEGYLNAKIFCHALKKVGRELTRKALIEAFHSMENEDFGGINISLGEKDHQGMAKVYLTQVKEGKAQPIS